MRKALKTDPTMPDAAYNLGVLLAEKDIDEAILWCRKAYELRPNEAKYGYTLGFYLRQTGDEDEAVKILRETIKRRPLYGDSYMLLGSIYEEREEFEEALSLYNEAMDIEELPEQFKRFLQTRVHAINDR